MTHLIGEITFLLYILSIGVSLGVLVGVGLLIGLAIG